MIAVVEEHTALTVAHEQLKLAAEKLHLDRVFMRF